MNKPRHSRVLPDDHSPGADDDDPGGCHDLPALPLKLLGHAASNRKPDGMMAVNSPGHKPGLQIVLPGSAEQNPLQDHIQFYLQSIQ